MEHRGLGEHTPASLVTLRMEARRMERVSLIAALCVAAWSCAEGEATHAGVTRTDSSGVSIVTNPTEAVANAPRWTLSVEPVLSIVTPEDGRYTLLRVGDIVPLPAGRLVVADGGEAEVLVFGAGGDLLLRFGKPGDGPGEFRSIDNVFLRQGDSLAVYDGGHRRLSMFDSAGHLGRDLSLSSAIESAGGAFGSVLALGGSDLMLHTDGILGTASDTKTEGVIRANTESLHLTADGATVASYGKLKGSEMFHSAHLTGPVLFGPLPVVATVGEDFIVGTGDTTELRTYGPLGTLSRIVRWPGEMPQVTEERVNAFVEAVLARVPPDNREAIGSRMKEVPHAQRQPPYETLLTGPDGFLWVGSYRGPDVRFPDAREPVRHWVVLQPDGSVAATVDTPEGFGPRAIQDGRVIGVYKDGFGVESIRAYSIEAGA
jgi:hypothetical protein